MNRSRFFVVPLLLMFTIAAAEMATAIYTPCLSMLAQDFGVSEAVAQWTVSINLFGLALSGPIYGPWSDCFGRRLVLCIGMGIFLCGTLLALTSESISFLLFARFVQGLGAGVAVVVAFAVVRDLFDEIKSAQILSYMGMVIALSPGCAPILGGYLGHHYGWKMCFALMSIVALMVALCLFFGMPETLPKSRQMPFSLKSIRNGYIQAFKNKYFILLALIPSSMIGGLWAMMTGLPVLFVTYLEVPIQAYGYYGFSGVLCYMLGTFINSKSVHKFSLTTLLCFGLSSCLISTCSLLIAGFCGTTNPLNIQILCLPYAVGLAFILPNGTALAFGEVKENLGISSSLLGSLEMGLGALGVYLAGHFFEGTIISIAAIMMSSTLLSIGMYAYLVMDRLKQIKISSPLSSH